LVEIYALLSCPGLLQPGRVDWIRFVMAIRIGRPPDLRAAIN
jgi:hypothetical protein